MNQRILLLGSGELGKEFVIAAKRYGIEVMAVDRYPNAPAMQVADQSFVCDMTDREQLNIAIEKFNPAFIVPEVEAIDVDYLVEIENNTHITIVPCASAVKITMDRLALRKLAAEELGLKTAKYRYADTLKTLAEACYEFGHKCVVKPIMSSSGKGQTIVKNLDDVKLAFENISKGRGKRMDAIVEEFIDFDQEITILTVSQSPKRLIGEVICCPAIGHRQEHGDYRESWQPARDVSKIAIKKAEEMAKAIVRRLGGCGVWGVEFFVKGDEVYFSELSPRPHDTGMVTLSNNQTYNEFELHTRAILGYPIHEVSLNDEEVSSVSVAIVANEGSQFKEPRPSEYRKASSIKDTDFRIFGKPECWVGRRMGVVLSKSKLGLGDAMEKAKQVEELLNFQSCVKK